MTPRLRKDGSPAGSGSDGEGSNVDWQLANSKLSPSIRRQSLAVGAISSIPTSAIRPFIGRPLIMGEAELKVAPTLIAGQETRVVLSAGDTALSARLLLQQLESPAAIHLTAPIRCAPFWSASTRSLRPPLRRRTSGCWGSAGS